MDLQKAFTKALILRHFDLKCHIHIETDTLRYAISKVFNQMILEPHSSGHVTYKGLNSEIG